MKHLILHLFTIASVTALLVSCKEKHIEEEPVTRVTIYPSSFTMVEGERRKVEVVILPQNASYGSVKWVSSNNRIVSVTDGTVSALAPGSAEITAIAGGIPGKSVVTVEAKQIPVEAVHLSQESMELTEGDASQLTATVLPENASNKNIRWESTNTGVATVSNGKVTAVKAGETEIVFRKDSKTYSCKVTVNAKPAEAQPQQNAQAQAGTDAQQSSASQSGQPAQSSSQSAPSSSASAKNGSSSAKSSSSENASSSSQRSSVQKSQSTPNKTASSSSGSARKSANSAQSGKSNSTGNKGGTVEVERQWTGKNGNYGGTLTDEQAHKLLGDDYDEFMHSSYENED